LPSDDDYRDYIYELGLRLNPKKKLPTKLDYRNDLLEIRNQGDQATCVGLVGACIKEWQERMDINFREYMSGQFLYNLRTSGHNGMTGRDLMKTIKCYGSCPERYYPYGLKEKLQDISRKILIKAKRFGIQTYAQVMTIGGLKSALIENGPCYISMPVYQFENDHFWGPIKPYQKRLGGQALVVIGYNKKGFILRNSWGSKWGDSGYIIYPYSEWGSHWEIWTLIDIENRTLDVGDSIMDFRLKKEETVPDIIDSRLPSDRDLCPANNYLKQYQEKYNRIDEHSQMVFKTIKNHQSQSNLSDNSIIEMTI